MCLAVLLVGYGGCRLDLVDTRMWRNCEEERVIILLSDVDVHVATLS